MQEVEACGFVPYPLPHLFYRSIHLFPVSQVFHHGNSEGAGGGYIGRGTAGYSPK